MKRLSFSFVLGPLLAALLSVSAPGCGDDVEAGACSSFCGRLCQRMKDCNTGDTSASCEASCRAEVQDRDRCGAEADAVAAFSCEQVSHLVACSDYCDAVCSKAAPCTSDLDAKACGAGCGVKHASDSSACDAASVQASTCEQVQGEARCYAATPVPKAGQAKSDSSSSLCGGGDTTCSSALSCPDEQGCNKQTGRCGPCASHDDCTSGGSKRFCTDDHRCVYAECFVDDDCKEAPLGPLCRDGKCVKCGSAKDCSEGWSCDPYDGCVQCKADADCDPTEACYQRRCWKRCSKDDSCGDGSCFLDHCTAPVGAPCGGQPVDDACGGGSCLNVSASNLTVEPYCTRFCYDKTTPCPGGFVCDGNECKKP